MAFKKEIKRLDKSNINLTITVPKDDVHKQYQDMLGNYIKDIQMPGFRKGKVPKEVFERKYADALKQDALGRIIESVLGEIFQDENLPRNEKPLPYSNPELQGEPKFEFEQDLQFSVIYDVLPEVKIDAWKGIKAEYSYAEVEKIDIDRELEAIRERNAIVMDKDDNAQAAKNDVVTINYLVMEEDGVTESSIKRDDFTFALGSNSGLYQFDDEITGMKKGEKMEIEKTFKEGFFEPSLAGKSRKVRITLTSLKVKNLPELDDDLAQDVDEKYKTLDDLKNSIKNKLEKNLERHLRDVKTSELLKKIMENTPVVIPESMIKAEVDGRIRRMAQYYNVNAESMMQMMSLDDKRQIEWRETAVKALHSRLIIETLMEEQKIEATYEDIEKEFESIAGENNVEIEEIKKHYDEQAVFYLKEDIREKKITDILLAENTLKPGKKENYLDFMSDNN